MVSDPSLSGLWWEHVAKKGAHLIAVTKLRDTEAERETERPGTQVSIKSMPPVTYRTHVCQRLATDLKHKATIFGRQHHITVPCYRPFMNFLYFALCNLCKLEKIL